MIQDSSSPEWLVWNWLAPTGWPVAIGDLVAKFDRSSGRDHEKLVSLLINHEMALRGAERNVRWTARAANQRGKWPSRARPRSDSDGASRPGSRRCDEPASTRISRPRGFIWEKLPPTSIRPMGGVPEPSEPDRIRLFGQAVSLHRHRAGNRGDVSQGLADP